jgi:hypothetical protein
MSHDILRAAELIDVAPALRDMLSQTYFDSLFPSAFFFQRLDDHLHHARTAAKAFFEIACIRGGNVCESIGS